MIKINFSKRVSSVKLLLAMYAFCMLFLASCQQDVEPSIDKEVVTLNQTGWFSDENYDVKDKLAAKLAKNLAAKMEYPEVREFVKSEIKGESDGMNSFTFQFASNKPITYTASNNQRVSTTFGRLVAGSEGDTNLREADSFLDSLRDLYPTLHVAIPDINENKGQEWKASAPLDVAYLPNKFAYEIRDVQVFEEDGSDYSISPYAEPEEHIVVVGINHQVVAVAKDEAENGSKSGERQKLRCPVLEPAYQDEQFMYYDAQTYYSCTDPIPGTGGGTGGGSGDDDDYNDPNDCITSADRWTNNNKEHMTKFKYKDIDAFRYYHGTMGSIKRHILYVLYSDIDDLGPTAIMKSYIPSRSDLRDYNLFSATVPKWYTVNEEIQTWDYMEHGDTYTYYWLLEGTGNTTTRSFSHTSGFDAEIVDGLSVDSKRTGSVEVESKDEDVVFGNAKVEFCDESVSGYIYSTGDAFEFEVKQMN